jgi:hypothetical protein
LRSIDGLRGWIVWPCIAIKTLLSIGPDVTQDKLAKGSAGNPGRLLKRTAYRLIRG